MAIPLEAYDIMLDGMGYILARQTNLNQEGRSWSVQSLGYSTTQQSADEQRYGNAPATIESAMVWRTTHLGYGEERTRIEGAYNYSLNMDARFYEQVLPGPKLHSITIPDYTVNVSKFAEQDGVLYCANGRYLNKIGLTHTVTSYDMDDNGIGSRISDMIVFDDDLVIACGDTGYLRTKTSGDVWTLADTTSEEIYAYYLSKWSDRLYAALSTYQVANLASGADPTVDGNWSALYTIGDQTTEITSLEASSSLVFVGKEDGVHGLDASWICPPLTPEMRAYRSGLNCKNMTMWHGDLYVPHLRGLLAYRDLGDSGSQLKSVGPGREASDENPVRGRVTAMAGDDHWLYLALYTGEDTYILAGRSYTFSEGYEKMLWHPLALIEDAYCGAMHISGLWDSPRLFFGVNQNVGYIILPDDSDNPLQDSDCRYALSGSIYYSSHSWNAPNTAKLWKSIEIQGDNLTSQQYFTVYYRVDKGDWTLAGEAKVSPSVTIGLSSGRVFGREIEIRLDYTMTNERSPIVLHTVIVRGLERPVVTDVISAVIRCASNLPLRTRGTCPRTGAQILAELKALAETEYAVDLIDVIGSTRKVAVLAPIVERVEYDQQGEIPRETLAEVSMVEIEFNDTRFTEVILFAGGSARALLVPLIVPIMLGGESMDEDRTFTSTLAARPRITIVGPARNVVITHEGTGKVLDLTGYDIGPLSVITIDMHRATAVAFDEYGDSVLSYLTDNGSDTATWAVRAGSNTVNVTGDGVTETTRVILEY